MKETQLIITWNRETGEASFKLEGLSHVEAQRLLLIIAQVNHDQALAELAGQHHYEEQGHHHEH